MSAVTPENITAQTLSDPEVIANPYPFYAALRAQSPVYGYRDLPPGTVPGTDEAPPAWAVLSHEQVSQAARDAETFSSKDPLQEGSDAPTLMLVNHDEPEHRALRNLVQPAFIASRIADQETWISEQIGQLLDALPEKDNVVDVDIMAALAADIPALVMTRMLDMPQSDFARFRQWATAFMLSTPLTPEQRNQSNMDMIEYFTTRVQKFVAGEEHNAFIATLLPANQELHSSQNSSQQSSQKTLSPEEVIRFCFTLVVAGAETTTGLMGNLLWICATQPDAYQTISEDDSRIDSFIEETLRIAGPPQRLFRIATQDTQLGDQQIAKGDWVALFFAAANHDPQAWEDPQQFKLDRQHGRMHFSFGHGIHSCLGSMLVRLESRCLLRALKQRYTHFTAGDAPFVRQRATQLSYALDNCPVRLHKR